MFFVYCIALHYIVLYCAPVATQSIRSTHSANFQFSLRKRRHTVFNLADSRNICPFPLPHYKCAVPLNSIVHKFQCS
jgi:hypothetical protein